MPLEIKETYINATDSYRFGESKWAKSDTADRGQLYKRLVKEYGRCISKVYTDELQVNGRMAAIESGWVFVKRMKYEDSKDTYLREVWVEVRETE